MALLKVVFDICSKSNNVLIEKQKAPKLWFSGDWEPSVLKG